MATLIGFESELLSLRERFLDAGREYARTASGAPLDALAIHEGRREAKSADEIHRLLVRKGFVDRQQETVWFHTRFGLNEDRHENPVRRLSLIGNEEGSTRFRWLCKDALTLIDGIDLQLPQGSDGTLLIDGRSLWPWNLCRIPGNDVPPSRLSSTPHTFGESWWLWLLFEFGWHQWRNSLLAFGRFVATSGRDEAVPYDTEKPSPYFHSFIRDVFVKSASMVDAMLRKIVLESNDPPAKPPGPFGTSGFRWNNKEKFGLRPGCFALVSHLWTAKDRTSPWDDLAEPVFEVRDGSFVDSGNLGSVRRDANKFFEEHGFPFRVTLATRFRKAVLVERPE